MNLFNKTPRCGKCGTELWDYQKDLPVTTCPQGCNPPEPRVVTLKVASSQEDLSCQMMDELRAVILNPKYDPVYISTLLGVLVMLQHESIERSNAK